ncbi:hypothetical protein AM500_03250 [Bacillus sp. FJAT-18017]|uniref:ATP-binding protein n=1 Tax=Bacillus sp. FJAT-18017 TaxID=1705566 RepID=UPI0006AF2AB7|nr:ATP-binding protein [Bacillus sp. FJAT-18017]ALC88925.1 hypothetical protein AM500_03250 [Bacillus sp. FJAT-18017]
MDKLTDFPFGLAKASNDEKKEYFLKMTLNHPKLNEAFLEVIDRINTSPSGKVILVYGPTGVGKSTLCKRVKKEIIQRFLDNGLNIQNIKGTIPVAMLELPSSDNGKFNWRDFYKRLLNEMNEPLVEYKISRNSEVPNKKIPNHWPSTSPELRESLENAISYRNTKVILLDEAQHLLKIASGKNIKDQLDALKSIANLTGALFILFGTYELMDFFDLSGQLGRRTKEIHFPRYNLNITKDKHDFHSVIYTFQNRLPFIEKTDLLYYADFLYERTIGCIGILKEWLDECVNEALNKNLPSISFDVLERNAPTPSKALTIAQETIEGETKVNEQGQSIYLLRETIGLSTNSKQTYNESGKSTQGRKNNVGIRNPTRDKIGLKEKQT